MRTMNISSELQAQSGAVRVLLALLCVIVTACGDGVTAPSPGAALNGYAGRWSGTVLVIPFVPPGLGLPTTTQSQPLSFTVSADQKVTEIEVGYNFNGCSGVKTFSGLNLAIANPPNPTSPGPAFGYGSETRDGTNYTQIAGWFTSDRTASGTAGFVEFSGCGSGGGNWNATKQ